MRGLGQGCNRNRGNRRGRKNNRRIQRAFNEVYFKPRGIPLNQLTEISISFEELESLRLRYIEKLSQNDSAEKMEISQSQYQRDLTQVLEKLTKALINGEAIRIEAQKS